MHENEKKIVVKQKGSFGTFVRGALIGAGLAMLFAPRSGKETRAMLSERGGKMYDKAAYVAKDTRYRAQNIVQDARNKIEDTFRSEKQIQDPSTKELKRELEIMEDINNPNYPL